MLHAPAASAFSNVQQEHVMIERRAVHELDFILANFLQILFNKLPPPFFPVDNNGYAGQRSGQIKLLKLTDFHWTVRKRAIARALGRTGTMGARVRANYPSRRLDAPIRRDFIQRNRYRFRLSVWNIKQNHRRIDECMFTDKLRPKWSDFIPIRGVANRNRPIPVDPPGLLVKFFDRSFLGPN